MAKSHPHKKTFRQNQYQIPQMQATSNIFYFVVLILAIITFNCPAEVAEPNLNELVGQLDIETADINDIISIFGEPMEYVWGRKYFTRDNLPDRYVARYPYGFHIWMYSGRISEVRFESLADDYLFRNKIHIGSSLEEVLDVAGQPKKAVRDLPCDWEDGVLYENIDKVRGYCYYSRPDQNVRFFFSDYKVTALYLLGTAESQNIKVPAEPVTDIEATEPDIAESAAIEPNINERVAGLDFETADIDEVIRIFGEPADYFRMGKNYRKDDLPEKYLARYPDGFTVVMDSGSVSELRFESASSGYLWREGIRVGSSLDEVLDAADEPAEVVTHQSNDYIKGILYKDINGIKGYCYYSPAEENVKFYFLKNELVALHLTNEYAASEVSDALTTEPESTEGEITEPNINERLVQLDFEAAGLDEVIRIFGEPMHYFWSNQLYTKDNLPRQYLARYPGGLSIWVHRGMVKEVRFEAADAGYVWRSGIKIGSFLEEVLEAAGPPQQEFIGGPNEWVDGVLYRDINDKKGRCYYSRSDENVRFFFSDYKVSAIYLTGNVGHQEVRINRP